jgi:hypothetical protein
MGRFVNDQTGVVVSVDDSKDERFASGWTAEKAPAKAERESAKKADQKSDSKSD